jgi:hypothetical protein
MNFGNWNYSRTQLCPSESEIQPCSCKSWIGQMDEAMSQVADGMHTSGTGSAALALYAQLDKSMAGVLLAEREQG